MSSPETRVRWTRRTMLLAVVNAAALFGCAPTTTVAPRVPEMDRYVLTRADFVEIDSLENVYAVIAQKRPWFLRPRQGSGAGKGEAPRIAVFLNGLPAGGVEALLGIPVHRIHEVRLIRASDAHKVFGGGRGLDAAINVVLRSSSTPLWPARAR